MKQVCVKADDSQTITAIYEFLHDLDNEYSNFSKWYYSTVVPGLASENRIIYTMLLTAYCLKSKTIAACRKMWYNSKEVIP